MQCLQQYIATFIFTLLYKDTPVWGQLRGQRDRPNDIMRLNIPGDDVNMNINTNTICGNTAGITRQQYELCIRDPNAVASAIQGIQIAIYECKRQFRDHRWNCTSLETKNKIPHTTAFFRRGYPETSFAYAIASAGVAHAVAHACSLGKIEGCGCTMGRRSFSKRLSASQHKAALKSKGNLTGIRPELTQFLWSGCDHNINFGIKFSQKFLDESEPANDHRTLAMLHNNRVGRLIVGNNMARKCTCHGTSGSCSLKTCWKHTPDFKLVGKTIKVLYNKAYKIEPSNRVDGFQSTSNELRQLAESNNIDYKETYSQDISSHYYPNLGVSINILVYFEDSPEFCVKDRSIGFHGTKGRYCNRTAPAESKASCADLCCHRGYRTYKQTRIERCHCRFHWCCYVNCLNCTITEKVAVCR